MHVDLTTKTRTYMKRWSLTSYRHAGLFKEVLQKCGIRLPIRTPPGLNVRFLASIRVLVECFDRHLKPFVVFIVFILIPKVEQINQNTSSRRQRLSDKCVAVANVWQTYVNRQSHLCCGSEPVSGRKTITTTHPHPPTPPPSHWSLPHAPPSCTTTPIYTDTHNQTHIHT